MPPRPQHFIAQRLVVLFVALISTAACNKHQADLPNEEGSTIITGSNQLVIEDVHTYDPSPGIEREDGNWFVPSGNKVALEVRCTDKRDKEIRHICIFGTEPKSTYYVSQHHEGRCQELNMRSPQHEQITYSCKESSFWQLLPSLSESALPKKFTVYQFTGNELDVEGKSPSYQTGYLGGSASSPLAAVAGIGAHIIFAPIVDYVIFRPVNSYVKGHRKDKVSKMIEPLRTEITPSFLDQRFETVTKKTISSNPGIDGYRSGPELDQRAAWAKRAESTLLLRPYYYLNYELSQLNLRLDVALWNPSTKQLTVFQPLLESGTELGGNRKNRKKLVRTWSDNNASLLKAQIAEVTQQMVERVAVSVKKPLAGSRFTSAANTQPGG